MKPAQSKASAKGGKQQQPARPDRTRVYEAFIILKPVLDVDNSDAALKGIEDALESQKAKVLKRDKVGRKRLAYEIGNFKDGFIVSYLFEMNPANLEAFNRVCQINEDILRLMVLDRKTADFDNSSPQGPEQREQRPERRPVAAQQ